MRGPQEAWHPGDAVRVALLALALGGCAGPLAGSGSVATAARYPASAYIVAEGVSTEGFEQAEARARAGVAAQVRSELSAVLTATARSSVQDGVRRESEVLESAIVARTAFAHAELIRIDAHSRRVRHGRYHALAYAARAELAAPLAEDYAARAAAFRALAATALAPEAPVRGWAACRARADTAFAALEPLASAWRAIMGSEPAGASADRERSRALAAAHAARWAAVTVELRVTGEPAVRVPLTAAATRALASLGLRTRSTPGDSSAWGLVLEPRLECAAGTLGPVCRMTLGGTLRAPAPDGARLELALADADDVGADVRDPARARQRLLDGLTSDRLRARLARELAPYLPFPPAAAAR